MDRKLKILVVGTSIFTLPPAGYSGLEMLVYQWACEFQKAGHQVTVTAPEGSVLPSGMDVITTALGEGEDVTYMKYKDRMVAGAWDVVMDNSWAWFSVLSQMEAFKQLPVVHIYHSDYENLGNPPPIQYPCIVAISEHQASGIRRKFRTAARVVYNGVDTSIYKPNPAVQRGDRYLWIARYTPEKMPLDTIRLARRCKVSLDMFGDTNIIGPNQEYANRCFQENDGRQFKVAPGITRDQVVTQMQNHKAIIHMVGYNEAFGLVPVEAMACGCPVIVNERGALPELVKHGKSGFVVGSLEEAEELIKSDAVATLRTEDIVAQAQKFTIEKSAAKHLKCLEDVANGYFW